MGSACSCVSAKDTTTPNRVCSGALHQSVGYSPSWSFRWDHRGRVAGETENFVNRYTQGRRGYAALEIKSHEDTETEEISDGGSPVDNLQTPTWQKTPIHEGIAGRFTTPVSDLSMGSSFSTQARDLTEASGVAEPTSSKLSFSMSESDHHSFSRSLPPPGESTPSRRARRSPGHQLLRGVFDGRFPGFIPGFKSPTNNSASEGRQSFVLSQGSSDGWSMRTFSELVASSQRDRWSFDSETFNSSGRGKISRANSFSIDLRACGVCSKLLTERSSWNGNELSVTAVLFCGHAYHAECLENMTSENDKHDPTCPLCISGEKQALKISGKALRINNRRSRNRVVDGDLEDDSVSCSKSSGSEGKISKIEPSSSVRNAFVKPFLKRHFSLGSKKMFRSLTINESPARKKGFWARYVGAIY